MKGGKKDVESASESYFGFEGRAVQLGNWQGTVKI